jgi:hypothetical protein
MNIRIFKVDLRTTNELLERIANSLEAHLELLQGPPQEAPPVKREQITANDVGVYGGGEEETQATVAARMRKAGASDADIEKLLLAIYDAAEDEVAG